MDNQTELIIMELTSELSFYQSKFKELKAENAKLTSILSSCTCHKVDEIIDTGIIDNNTSAVKLENLKIGNCIVKGKKKPKKRLSDARRALQLHLEKECRTYKLQAAIFHEALSSLSSIEDDDSAMSNKTKKKVSSHVPLMSRPSEPSYDERRAKLTFSAAAEHKSVVTNMNSV